MHPFFSVYVYLCFCVETRETETALSAGKSALAFGDVTVILCGVTSTTERLFWMVRRAQEGVRECEARAQVCAGVCSRRCPRVHVCWTVCGSRGIVPSPVSKCGRPLSK